LPSGGGRRQRLLASGGGTAGGPFAAATGLGFAGFFFPLLKPVLGMGGQPAIWQQGFQGNRQGMAVTC